MKTAVMIESLAQGLRDDLGLDSDDSVPDVVHCIQSAGFVYKEDYFGDDFSGLVQSLGSGKYLVAYNLDHDYGIGFKRFTLCHELGHLTIRDHLETVATQHMHRSCGHYRSRDPMESEADMFAIGFLAPAQSFSKAAARCDLSADSILGLAAHFGISTHAAALRLVDLTDLTCAAVVCSTTGVTEYEKRSATMAGAVRLPYLRKTKVDARTLTYEHISGRVTHAKCDSLLNYWHPALKREVRVIEEVFDLGYQGKLIALLTPHEPRLDEFLTEHDP